MSLTIFKKGQPIVLGIKKASGLSKIEAEDFTLKLAYTYDPLTEKELDVKVIDDDPYWWTEPFYLFKEADYIFHWINDNASIDYKQRIRVSDEYFDGDDSDIMV